MPTNATTPAEATVPANAISTVPKTDGKVPVKATVPANTTLPVKATVPVTTKEFKNAKTTSKSGLFLTDATVPGTKEFDLMLTAGK